MRMRGQDRSASLMKAVAVGLLSFVAIAARAQQGERPSLPIHVDLPPKLFLHQEYQIHFEAGNGRPPLTWSVSQGSPPPGFYWSGDGILRGNPTTAGEFRFTVAVTDGNKPAQSGSREVVMRVLAPLWAEWSRPPKVSGGRIEGAIKVSNETDQDFDLTFVVLAVNEIGRATTIGYQRFTLKKDTVELQIPFGENLSSGTYEVNADVVGEVAPANKIYRARLVTPGLRVQQGP